MSLVDGRRLRVDMLIRGCVFHASAIMLASSRITSDRCLVNIILSDYCRFLLN